MQKLTARKVALEKSTSTSHKDKQRWRECLVEELISSEESEEDGSFLVHLLPWRSEKVLLFVGQEAWEENVQKEQNDDFRKEGRTRVSACQASYWVSAYTWAVRS